MGEIFRSALTENEMIDAASVDVLAGQFVKLGERKVEAGELITIGFGMQSGQQSAQGRIYMDIQNSTPAALEGTLRLSVYSPQDRPLKIMGEWRTETLRTGAGDRTQQVPLPENLTWLSEDKKLVLEFEADASGTVSKTNTNILLDTTTEAL